MSRWLGSGRLRGVEVRACAGHVAASRPHSPSARRPRLPPASLSPRYCVTCHNERTKTANLLLDKADAEQVSELGRDVGESRRAVAQPGDAACRHAVGPTTPPTTRRRVARDGTGSRGHGPPEPGPARRICIASIAPSTPTRFAICWESRSMPPAMLPPDTHAAGFDTNADALAMEPALLDRYLTAAAKIARVAVGDPTLRPVVRALHRCQGQLERADLAVADRSPGRSLSARLARRHRGPSLLPASMASTSSGSGC